MTQACLRGFDLPLTCYAGLLRYVADSVRNMQSWPRAILMRYGNGQALASQDQTHELSQARNRD